MTNNEEQILFDYPSFNRPVKVGFRLRSMLLEHLIQCLFMIPSIIPSIIAASSTPPYKPGFSDTQHYLLMISYAIYFSKDCMGGRSIAKRILGLQVVDNKVGTAATPIQCLIRNIFIIVFPLEVLVTLFSPDRRIGDRLAGTRVIYFDLAKRNQKINILQVILCFMIAYAISWAVIWAINRL